MRHKLTIMGQVQVILHINKKTPIVSAVSKSVLYVFIKKSAQNHKKPVKYNK